MFKKIIVSTVKGFTRFSFSLLRALLIGGLTVGFLIMNVNSLTNPEYGVINLVIIASSFAFFPTFFVLLSEFFLYDLRKKRKKIKEEEDVLTASDL